MKTVEVPVIGLVGAGVLGVGACVATGVVSYKKGYKDCKNELFSDDEDEVEDDIAEEAEAATEGKTEEKKDESSAS